MEMIDVKLDETNEVFFNVQVEGTSPGAVSVRLVCEADDFSAVFPGKYTETGEVRVVIPEMKRNGSFKENKDYTAHLEVMVENKYFVPLRFGLRFKETVKVFAEVATKVQSVVESKDVEKKQDVVEVKKTSPIVSANIVKEAQKPVLKKEAASPIVDRQKSIFDRLTKQAIKK